MKRDKYELLRRVVQSERAEAVRRSKMKSVKNYRNGFQAGYARGVTEGQRTFAIPFEGTSIIIPTYNQKELVLQCIASIEAHTEQPYEIIVVDDGSVDGTREALQKRRGLIRVGVHSENLGFASAVNTGLMMAKGNMIVLLNNDVLVTERWLSQLLTALNSNKGVAAVGPVTNYIGGEQQINTTYKDLPEMAAFAANYNATDRSKWWYTDRLVGFCLLFSRKTFEEVGYFDEGYKIGNFEDDDWILRLQLQGKRLMIAGDTFVHHIGSVSMKSLGEEGFAVVNGKNEQFYHQKWGRSLELLRRMKEGKEELRDRRSVDFYPTHVWVEGGFGKRYWLEHGMKYPLSGLTGENTLPRSPVRLSVIDLMQIPTGAGSPPPNLALIEKNGLREGAVIQGEDGKRYQLDRGQWREIVSTYTCELWGLSGGAEIGTPEELGRYGKGLPILPPPRLESQEL
ncbi:glycosyltransferase family 2 protein [Paenibacillus bouchesdurhonensis]|uniref:glycosyltransferase family 2 protein n=1 Tax=Paenibacillus bouchesdurhonensis TaxID=1870990 RepID=UPI001F3DFDCA|nr:glycosyltransferase family 2 protein [Paenibacillus bouchesdurhonensis]